VRRAFTMIEMLLAVFLVGLLTTFSVLTFNSVSRGWQISTDYMDKMQRTDFALNQVISGLRSMYYPHDGKQSDNYGFVLINNGDGEDPDSSDIIEWSKTGSAIVGTKSAVADTVHRVQLMILEEGNDDYRDANGRRYPIEVTGLYARQCPDVALRPAEGEDKEDIDYTFQNAEMYQPVLISDGIVGFNCRVLKTADSREKGARNASENDADSFEDEFSDTGDGKGADAKSVTRTKGVGGDKNDTPKTQTVPYKIELTFRMSDPEGKGYRSNTAPIMRIIRIPIHEQSLDGNATPDSDEKGAKGAGASGGSSGGGTSGGAGGSGAQRGVGRGGAPAGGAPAGGGGPMK